MTQTAVQDIIFFYKRL